MNKILRAVAVLTLSAYVGLVVRETFHTHHAGQSEAQCALCQVAHTTPVLTQGQPTLQHQQIFSQVTSTTFAPAWVEVEPTYSGRSPPVL